MIKETVQFGDPKLIAPNKIVENFDDPKIKRVVEDLTDSMRNSGHVGMAAPQIGENYRIFVTEIRPTKSRTSGQVDELRVLINPKIVDLSEEKVLIWEGCGSVARAQIFGPVNRPKEITIEAQDLAGKKFVLVCDGLLARVIQHENDHLNGIQFIERMENRAQLKTAEDYRQNIRDLPELVEATVITKKTISFL